MKIKLYSNDSIIFIYIYIPKLYICNSFNIKKLKYLISLEFPNNIYFKIFEFLRSNYKILYQKDKYGKSYNIYKTKIFYKRFENNNKLILIETLFLQNLSQIYINSKLDKLKIEYKFLSYFLFVLFKNLIELDNIGLYIYKKDL